MTLQPHLHFLGWHRPALQLAASILADRYAADGELRMSAATVAVPGGRAGRRLKELLLEEAGNRGLRLLPPMITTVGQLPELLYAPPFPLAGDALCRRVWMRSLRDLSAGRRERLFPAPPAAADVRGWVTLSRVLERLHTEVAAGGHRFDDVAACCTGGFLFCDQERWQVLDELQRDYEARLRSLGFVDRELARMDALRSGELRLDVPLWLLGVAEMPALLRAMLLGAQGSGGIDVLVHAPESEREGFDELGSVRPARWLEREIPLDEARLAVRDRPADQAREAIRVLGEQPGRFSADEITIGVADPELTPFLAGALGDAGVPVRDAAGTPLGRTAPFRFLEAVADHLGGGFGELAALVRHPDVEHWLNSSASGGEWDEPEPPEWLPALDQHHGDHLPARFDAPGAEGSGGGTVGMLCALLDGELLRELQGSRPSAEWCEAIVELLIRLYETRALDAGDAHYRRCIAACREIADAAAAIQRLPARVDEPCAPADAIALLLDEAMAATIPPEADAAAVDMLGWLELHLDDAPLCIITGFNEPFLPVSVSAHAFLPNALRAGLGLADNERRYARDAYQLTAILESRAHVRLIAGRRTAAGDPLRPSRLMLAVNGPALAERVQRFYARNGEAAASVPLAANAPGAASSGFRLPPEPVLEGRAGTESISITAFRSLLGNPYGYALEKVVGRSTPDDAARELDGAQFGDLAHQVLKDFGRSESVRSSDAAQIVRALDAHLDHHSRERFGHHPLPAVRVQIEQLRARLHAFARWHAGWTSDGWRVMAVEAGTPHRGVLWEVDDQPVHLRGRIDRIDHHPERGEWVLFDYKSGDNGRTPQEMHCKGKGDARQWIDLQLPLYHHVAHAVVDGQGRPVVPNDATQIGLGYINLCRDLDAAGASFAEWSDADLSEALGAARDVVRLLRRNRFEFNAARVSKWTDGALAALLGVGQLAGDDELDEVAQ